ncbi:putative transcription factor interactor and regulator CCHC(Zn) family [Helianthus anomalus]
MGIDMTNVKCYNCGIYGHFARYYKRSNMECSSRENTTSQANSTKGHQGNQTATTNVVTTNASYATNATPSTSTSLVVQLIQSVPEPYD